MANHPNRSKQQADHYVYGKLLPNQLDNRWRHDLWASCGQFLVFAVGKGASRAQFVVQRFYEKQVRDHVFASAADAYAYCNRRS